MALFFDRLFSSVALGHLTVDLINGQRGVLLAYLSIPLRLSNTAVGLVGTLYSLVSSLAQPVFGYLSDRWGPRWLVAGGVLWMSAFFALAVIVPGWPALACLIVASLGSGAFHPAGSAQATRLGRSHFEGREATAASFFFFFGQTGYFIGPLLGGPLLDLWGPPGLLLFAALGVPVGAFAGSSFREQGPRQVAVSGARAPARLLPAGIGWLPVTALVIAAACQSWAQQNVNIFLPKYLADAGQSASHYGLLTSLFMGGSALGNVVGGSLADRFGRRRVVFTGLALSSLPLFLMARVGASPWLYVLVPLAGLLNGAAFTVIVVQAQDLMPGGMALASGLILGFTFSAGALGTLASGALADAAGIEPVFALSAALGLVGGIAAFGLKRRTAHEGTLPAEEMIQVP